MRDALGDKVHAGGYAGDVKINRVSFFANEVTVIAKTPMGGLQGVKCGDLDTGAKAIFEKIYKDTGWKGGALVTYEGGLVDRATGRDLPRAVTGRFGMRPAQARQIDWSNGNALSNIDWSIYRTFCHRALQ